MQCIKIGIVLSVCPRLFSVQWLNDTVLYTYEPVSFLGCVFIFCCCCWYWIGYYKTCIFLSGSRFLWVVLGGRVTGLFGSTVFFDVKQNLSWINHQLWRVPSCAVKTAANLVWVISSLVCLLAGWGAFRSYWSGGKSNKSSNHHVCIICPVQRR